MSGLGGWGGPSSNVKRKMVKEQFPPQSRASAGILVSLRSGRDDKRRESEEGEYNSASK